MGNSSCHSVATLLEADGRLGQSCAVFCFNGPAPTQSYPLSLHDALPIFQSLGRAFRRTDPAGSLGFPRHQIREGAERSEEHTSELQSPYDLVCRLLLEKKKHHLTWPYCHQPFTARFPPSTRRRAHTQLVP